VGVGVGVSAGGGVGAGDPAMLAEVNGRFGGYRIIRLLGRGGMGEVYLAEQDRPRRTVALKAIRPELSTERLRRRFEHEAEVLGRLIHPGIARIYDAGITGDEHSQQPYFVMEYVEGHPLCEAAAHLRLDTRARLQLFTQICDAVHHAHQRGIIHRDLKPANILVDRLGHPRILDFGIAVATDAEARMTNFQTGMQQLVGTLPYMSPEQVSGDPRDIDVRSDVYALGVCLYELLADRLPLDVDDTPLPDAVRIICEEDAPSLTSLDRPISRDIATIVGKALEKNRDRRYQSAHEFGEDLRRFLRDEPINARPPSAFYQLSKFARRNRGVVTGAALAVIALVVGVIVSTTLYVESERARDAERAQLRVAQQQTRIANAVNVFLNDDVLATNSPEIQRGEEFTVKHMFDRAAARINGAFPDDPQVEATVRDTLGTCYHGLGEYEKAEEQFRLAAALWEKAVGPLDRRTLLARADQGMAMTSAGRLDEARPFMEDVLARCRDAHGADDILTIRCLSDFGMILWDQGDEQGAVALYEEAYAAVIRNHLEETDEYCNVLMNLGDSRRVAGRLEEAEAMLREAHERLTQRHGADHPKALTALNGLGTTLYQRGQREEAAAVFRQLLELRRHVLGPAHPQTITAMNNLAVALKHTGHLDEAEPLYRAAYETRLRVLGETHIDTLVSMNNLAGVYRSLGQYDEAEVIYRETLRIRMEQFGPHHRDTVISMSNLAQCLIMQQKYAEAARILADAVDAGRAAFGEDDIMTLRCRRLLADAMNREGDFVGAVRQFEAIEPHVEGTLGRDVPELIMFHRGYATCLAGLGRYDDAEIQFERTLAALERDPYAPATLRGDVESERDTMRREREDEGGR
ncbi:MAG: serine/threonine protein kinase, partial [Phycisphaerales bacterium]|nr:serine/threonine protein kinase [Phycisphaerales bacterium]